MAAESPAAAPEEIRRFKKLMAALKRDGLDFAYQSYGEFAWWLAHLDAIRPRRGIEIGTFKGGTACLTLAAVPGIERLVSVDLEDRSRDLPERAAEFADRLVLVQGESAAPATRLAVERALGGEPADFLFIDGDHSYESVTGDYAAYAPLVRAGGLIAFHDIAANSLIGAAHAEGVERFWAEIVAAAAVPQASYAKVFGMGVVVRG